MPDTTLETPPQPSVREAAEFHADNITNSTLPASVIEKQKKLREDKEKGLSGKDRLKRAAEVGTRTSFSNQEVINLELQFGGGKAEEDPTDATNPKAKIEEAGAEEKVAFETAQRTIEQINSYLLYREIDDLVERTGKTHQQIINERLTKGDGSIKTIQEYNEVRAKGLDAILESSAIKDLFPELDTKSPAERHAYIEAILAKNPKMRNEVATRMKAIAEKARNLPEITSDEELKTAEKTKKESETLKEAKITQLVESIGADPRIKDIAPENINKIKDMIAKGAETDSIISYIKTITVDVVDNASIYSQLFQLEKEANEADAGLRGSGGNKNTVVSNSYKTTFDQKMQAINELKKTQDFTQNAYESYKQLRDHFSNTSPVAAKLNEIIQMQEQITNSDRIIAEKNANPDKNARVLRNNRLLQEYALIDELDNVFSQAVTTTLESMYDDYMLLEDKYQKDVVEKQGTEDDKKIQKAMRENWIKYDQTSRSKTKDTAKINQDVRMLAYEGEEGIKRLMLRELGFTTQRKDANGNLMVDASGNPIMDTLDYRTVDLSSLSDEQKKRLEEVYTKNGDAFRDKLFKDMYLARSLGSKIKDRLPGTDKIGLKKHEWELLEQNFSGKLNEALAKSTEAQGVLKRLEAQGVKPDFKMKWLLYLLLAVGGAAALGAVGIGGVAVAKAAF